MRKEITIILLLVLIDIMLPTAAWAQTAIKLGSGYWPPYSDAELPYHGLLPHLASAAFGEVNRSVEFQFEDWDEILKLSTNGHLQGSIGWIKTQSRSERYYYSRPVIHATIVFLHRANVNFSWDNYADLKKYRIGTIDSYSYGDEFDQAVKRLKLDIRPDITNEANIQKLIDGKVDLVPVDRNVGEFLVHSKFSDHANDIKFDEKILASEALYFIAPKTMPDSKELIESFNRGLTKLQRTGQFQNMVENLTVINTLANFEFYTEQNGPMNYSENGQPRGVVTHVLKSMLDQIGADISDPQFTFVPWSRAYQEALKRPNVIVFSLTQTPERYDQFHWIGPIYRSNIVILGRQHLAPPSPGSGDRICAVRDDVGHQELLSHGYSLSQIELTSGADLCARMLISGRINYWVYGRDTSQWYLKRLGSDKSMFNEYQQLTESSRYIGISLDSDPAVIEALKRSFEYLQLNGNLSDIIQLELNQLE